ncbi:MAG: serine-rich protein [Anaerolineaceae bacterium]|nr:serine-rich protein [Anaerolineaceae bacterium]
MKVPDDLQVEASGVRFVETHDEMDYLWYRLKQPALRAPGNAFRVVRLLQLKFLPLEARSDPGLLQKMRTVLRGLYSSRVSFAYLAAGIFQDPGQPIGVVQCYGVTATAPTLEEACAISARALSSLQAAMAGAYRQVRLVPLTVRIAEWIFSAFHDMHQVIVTVGHPDPRETARGGSPQVLTNPLIHPGSVPQQYTIQQNEILFRGMSDLKEEFLFLVLTSPVALIDLSEMLTGIAEDTSTWATWQSGNRGVSFGISLPAFLSGSLASSASQGFSTATGQSHAQGTAQSISQSHTDGQAHTQGIAATQGWSHSNSISLSTSTGEATSTGQAETSGHAQTTGSAVTESSGQATTEGSASIHSDSFNWGLRGGIQPAGVGIGGNVGWGSADGTSVSQAATQSTGHAETTSQASTDSQSSTLSQFATESRSSSIGHTETSSVFGSTTHSESNTTSQADTKGTADTTSQADATQQSQGIGQALVRGEASGLSVGAAPSFSVFNSFHWEYDPAQLLTQILRQQQALLTVASKEGAYYTDFYTLARTPQGKQAVLGLIPEAFHGTEDVVSGVQTRELGEIEGEYIRLHAQAFTPSTRSERVLEAFSGYMDSTLLTMLQLATYTAPGVFEQGMALTIQESTPDFAFQPAMPGEVILGRQWSSETGQVTRTPLCLSRERHFHTAFVGDSGFGKSIAAERLAFETTLAWHFRTIILDFGQGWRRALNWGGLADRVDIRQLYPGAPRPLRWNLLQVPRRLFPGRYRTLVSELFANAGRMGPRQLGFLRRALTQVYITGGILTADPEVQNHSHWGKLVEAGEVEVVREVRDRNRTPGEVSMGTYLADLEPAELQALAVWRSQKTDVRLWVDRLKSYYGALPKGDQASRASLEGVLLRVEQFSEGQMAWQYGASTTSLPVEDLGLMGPNHDPWGLMVIEGGAEMDEYPKAALLSLLASILYFDGVVRRREALAGIHFPPMQIFFEEANKVLTGVSGSAAADQNASASQGQQVSEIFQTFWRDGRKYQIYLHLLAQTVSALPPGILSSCNNGFFFQSKHPADRDLILAYIGKSEKGIVNTEYKRYLARIPKEMAIAKLGYSSDVADLEPMLVHPLAVPGSEPAEQEILDRLGTNGLH